MATIKSAEGVLCLFELSNQSSGDDLEENNVLQAKLMATLDVIKIGKQYFESRAGSCVWKSFPVVEMVGEG